MDFLQRKNVRGYNCLQIWRRGKRKWAHSSLFFNLRKQLNENCWPNQAQQSDWPNRKWILRQFPQIILCMIFECAISSALAKARRSRRALLGSKISGPRVDTDCARVEIEVFRLLVWLLCAPDNEAYFNFIRFNALIFYFLLCGYPMKELWRSIQEHREREEEGGGKWTFEKYLKCNIYKKKGRKKNETQNGNERREQANEERNKARKKQTISAPFK